MDNSTKSTFPPADFDKWPGTRIGALVYLVLYIGWIFFLAFGCIRHVRRCFAGCWSCQGWCFGKWFWPILFGGLSALALHFIPCIWWTCDWGPNDGQGVRGAILFISWPVIAIAMMISSCAPFVDHSISQWAESESFEQSTSPELDALRPRGTLSTVSLLTPPPIAEKRLQTQSNDSADP